MKLETLQFLVISCAVQILSRQILLVDREDREHGVATHVRVSVVETRSDRRHERLQQLRFLQLAQKAQSRAADELVGVLQIL